MTTPRDDVPHADQQPDPRFVLPWTPRDLEDLDPDTRITTYWDVERGARGPEPVPAWVVTDRGALDTDLGVLKTGKEADVHLLRRAATDGSGAETVMAYKRYRDRDHRTFHRSSAYTDGRRTRRTRDTRALARKSAYGRAVAGGQWARAEWDALTVAWSAGLPVPYPVQIEGTALLLELVTDDAGDPAPRLAGLRPSGAEGQRLLAAWFEQLRDAVCGFARLGFAHGDLSPYNVLAAGPRIAVIDLPQVIDLAANPASVELLARDCRTLCTWFTARGYAVDADVLLADALSHAW